MEDKELYVMMTLISGLGPVTQNKLLTLMGGIDNCFSIEKKSEVISSLEAGELRMYNRALNAFNKYKNDDELRRRAKEMVASCYEKGIDIVTKGDPRYPWRFVQLPDVPIVLYIKGTLKINEYSRSLGVVGARRCTHEGKEQAIEAASRAVKENTAVISGMAKGIDSYAHTACIKEGGYTIAVLGNGPDICYPKEHQLLYEAIIKSGCIISEYPPGTRPCQYYFPQRNRIIAALSDELCVIDAGNNSGTRYTVDSCRKYRKEVGQGDGSNAI